jgi:hypothetical protein
MCAVSPSTAPTERKPAFNGDYDTAVSLVSNECGPVTVAPAVTTVGHTAGDSTITLTHAGTTYLGWVAADSSFHTAPKSISTSGATSYRVSITGHFTMAGFDALVTVDQHNASTGETCEYVVRWLGTRRP